MMQTITGVPANQVGVVVQDFIDAGFANVVVDRQEDGMYTVSAS